MGFSGMSMALVSFFHTYLLKASHAPKSLQTSEFSQSTYLKFEDLIFGLIVDSMSDLVDEQPFNPVVQVSNARPLNNP